MSEEKLRPVGRIDFLDTKGQTGESCYYYSEEDFLKTVKEEKQGHDFTEDFDENFYISQTSSELSLDSSKNRLYNYGADGEIVYSMTNPNVTYKVDKALKLKASYLHTSITSTTSKPRRSVTASTVQRDGRVKARSKRPTDTSRLHRSCGARERIYQSPMIKASW